MGDKNGLLGNGAGGKDVYGSVRNVPRGKEWIQWYDKRPQGDGYHNGEIRGERNYKGCCGALRQVEVVPDSLR